MYPSKHRPIVGLMLAHCCDNGPASNQHCVNVPCFLGMVTPCCEKRFVTKWSLAGAKRGYFVLRCCGRSILPAQTRTHAARQAFETAHTASARVGSTLGRCRGRRPSVEPKRADLIYRRTGNIARARVPGLKAVLTLAPGVFELFRRWMQNRDNVTMWRYSKDFTFCSRPSREAAEKGGGGITAEEMTPEVCEGSIELIGIDTPS